MPTTTDTQAEHTEMKPKPELKETMRRDNRGRLVIHIPMKFKKRGGRKEMILPPGCKLDNHQDGPSINKPLAIAVALGHRWLDLLIEGRFQSIAEIAEAVGYHPSNVRRFLKLTCLSPRFIRSILDGTEPDGMSLEGLREVPVRWENHREHNPFRAC